jgi:hypothetical protein
MADQKLDALVYATFDHQPVLIAPDVMTKPVVDDDRLGNNRRLSILHHLAQLGFGAKRPSFREGRPCSPAGFGMRADASRTSYDSVMRKLYVWHTRAGPFYIAERERRFHPVFQGESLGSYHSAAAAADDLAGGHTFSIPGGIDTADLGIPSDIAEWQIYQGE